MKSLNSTALPDRAYPRALRPTIPAGVRWSRSPATNNIGGWSARKSMRPWRVSVLRGTLRLSGTTYRSNASSLAERGIVLQKV